MQAERVKELRGRHTEDGRLDSLEIEELLDAADMQTVIGEWAVRTFPGSPNERMVGVVHHLRKEVDELLETVLWVSRLAAPGDWIMQSKVEAADCAILLFNVAQIMGFDLMRAVVDKHEINVTRTWKAPDALGICEHIEEG